MIYFTTWITWKTDEKVRATNSNSHGSVGSTEHNQRDSADDKANYSKHKKALHTGTWISEFRSSEKKSFIVLREIIWETNSKNSQ